MDMSMGDGDMPSGPLSTAGVNFSDPDQAADFLEDLLNDDQLKIIGNAYARYFWYGVAVAIGIASIFHWMRYLTLQLRLRAAARQQVQPARPKNIFSQCFATMTALAREATYLQLTPTHKLLWFRIPPLGTIMLLAMYLAFVLALEFINDSVPGAQFWQARGVRAGWLAVAQMPLLILLVGKNNLITLTTGVSYERLNVLHRWSARVMLLLAVFHFGFQSRAWSQYGLMQLEWTTDDCPVTGIAAFVILLWMNLSTLAPFRHWSYEFFVIQHIITFFGFIIAVMYHLPSTALWSRIYIYIPIALYLLDRLIRTALFAWTNLRVSRATLTALDGGVTKVRLSNAAIKHWSPGAHVLLSIPRFGWVQSHPATIASTPRSHNGDLVFILKSHKGFTKRIMASANNSATALLPHTKEEGQAQQNAQVASYHALLNGPYGGSPSDFAAFDSVCLVAGSTGITFTLPILQDIAHRAALNGKQLPVRHVHLVWCVKETSWVKWVNDEIAAAVDQLQGVGIEAKVSIYVTCSDEFTNESEDPKECGCECDKSLGPCCCVVVDEDGEGMEDAEAIKPTSAGQQSKDKAAVITEKTGSTSSSASSIESGKQTAMRLPILPCAAFYSGRPEISELLTALLDGADGESGVAVCGPIGLSTTVRNSVVRLSDQRAIHKGTGAQGCYLHVESFS
ncbi:hypothetical protein LTR36_004704 [Oleoguttula mirabilis]|uniref:FAD-binding FR-type domain-containing protein n=1 Tax=Oleoguttula mirabilis TaxID=1507867 RepID=A0AAV9JFE9_9PEZI|nr:hypothetical protein LTR36_004704 [Oleoguttula mirabilis]